MSATRRIFFITLKATNGRTTGRTAKVRTSLELAKHILENNLNKLDLVGFVAQQNPLGPINQYLIMQRKYNFMRIFSCRILNVQ